MIALREAVTDADLEAWRQVRIAVLPNERCATVDVIRRTSTPMTLFLVAEVDGRLAGSGIANKSDLSGDTSFVAPRVLPGFRRRGVGTALLRRLAEHAEGLGHVQVGSEAGDPESLAFARRFGFREVGRQVEQVRHVAESEEAARPPDGVELVRLSERPELFRRTYEELAVEAFEDIPTPGRITVTLETWEREWLTWPEGSFVALAGDEIVGCAGLVRDDDHADRAENSLTAVRRDWRGRGVARAVKQAVIAWASENGVRELYTWTQEGNENMRAVNEKLGYVARDVSVMLRAPLPLQ